MSYLLDHKKISEGYLGYKLDPFSSLSDVCGILSGRIDWNFRFNEGDYYSVNDYKKINAAFWEIMNQKITGIWVEKEESPLYERVLYKAVCAALDAMEDINIQNGDEVPELNYPPRRA
jgi:hypothetical protein